MQQKSKFYKLITLLLCAVLAFGTPITVLAETEEAVETVVSLSESSEPSSEEASEPSSEPSEPVFEPSSEPVSEPSSEPVSEPSSELVFEPSAEPASEPISVPTAEPVTEPSLESVSEPEETPTLDEPVTSDDTNSEVTDAPASDNTPALGSAPATTYENGQKVTANIPDAEKFLENGYDESLCWAATASNMIWTSGYGAEGTNPLTGTAFQNEDEVFDYFRKCFTDDAGDPSDAIKYYITGTYPSQGVSDCSQKKDNAPAGKVVAGFDSIPNNSLTFYDQTEYDSSILEAVGNITGKAVGAWIRFWNSDQNAFDTNAHWATLYDVVKDATNNIIGILLVDSDNDTVVNENDTDEQKREFSGWSAEAKADAARECPNTYTYYELESFRDPNSGGTQTTYSVLKNYVNGVKSLLAGLTILEIIPLSGGPDPDDNVDENVTNTSSNNAPSVNTYERYIDMQKRQERQERHEQEEQEGHSTAVVTTLPEQQTPTVQNLNDPAVVEAIFNSIKDMMIQADIDVYSPAGTVYDKNSGAGHVMVIRRLYTSLANVYVNGKRLPGNGKYYKITRLPNGLFTITFTDEYLKSLGNGEHSIKMDFVGSDALNTTITVK
ncbi:MAG: hypothetical protein K6E49_09120 [Lachnospiraceae bacterium]|nr:hypothetical protein [Lachnospiraceae bacterium]